MSSKDTSKKYLQKRTLHKLHNMTQRCFDLAMQDVANKFNISLYELSLMHSAAKNSGLMALLTRETSLMDSIEAKKIGDHIDVRYRELLCTLKTHDIENIILADELNKSPRANITIEALTDELVRRSLMGDKPKPDPRIYAKN